MSYTAGTPIWISVSVGTRVSAQTAPPDVTARGIYLVDIPTLTLTGQSPKPWAGQVKALRYAPSTNPNENLSLDWVRLVNIDATLCRTINWTGPKQMAFAAMIPMGKPVKQLTKLKRKPVDDFAVLEQWNGPRLAP